MHLLCLSIQWASILQQKYMTHVLALPKGRPKIQLLLDWLFCLVRDAWIGKNCWSTRVLKLSKFAVQNKYCYIQFTSHFYHFPKYFLRWYFSCFSGLLCVMVFFPSLFLLHWQKNFLHLYILSINFGKHIAARRGRCYFNAEVDVTLCIDGCFNQCLY